MSRIDILSKMLQNPKLSIADCIEALENLKKYFISKRNDESFEQFIKLAETLAEDLEIQAEFPEIRKRKRKRLFQYEATDDPISEPKEEYKVSFYLTILDQSITSTDERFKLLEQCNLLFSFLYQFYKMSDDSLQKACFDLDIKLQMSENDKVLKDLDGIELFNEIISYKNIFPTQTSPLNMLNNIIKNDLISCFPNFALSLRIFLTLPVSVASGERSFSKLKLIKNYLRSTMSQERLTNLAMISIESAISDKLDLSNVVDEFASKKARKIII